MITNGDMTVFCGFSGPDGRTWQRMYVHNVNWQDVSGSRAGDGGPATADRAMVYAALTIATAVIRKGDILIRGIVTEELGAGGLTEKQMQALHGSMRRVLSVKLCDNGSPPMQHVELEAG
ncbi:MAG: hypothetical protein LBD12_01990 [Clostridiales Family XIII bacterium]|jgi:hypothetical protein|nr:hypothetical protein [Clostridiales Family XIII bacterium]